MKRIEFIIIKSPSDEYTRENYSGIGSTFQLDYDVAMDSIKKGKFVVWIGREDAIVFSGDEVEINKIVKI